MDSVVLYITAAISAAALIISVLVLRKLNQGKTDRSASTAQFEQVIRDLTLRQEGMRRELNDSIRLLSELLSSNQRASADAAAQKLGDMERYPQYRKPPIATPKPLSGSLKSGLRPFQWKTSSGLTTFALLFPGISPACRRTTTAGWMR